MALRVLARSTNQKQDVQNLSKREDQNQSKLSSPPYREAGFSDDIEEGEETTLQNLEEAVRTIDLEGFKTPYRDDDPIFSLTGELSEKLYLQNWNCTCCTKEISQKTKKSNW